MNSAHLIYAPETGIWRVIDSEGRMVLATTDSDLATQALEASEEWHQDLSPSKAETASPAVN